MVTMQLDTWSWKQEQTVKVLQRNSGLEKYYFNN